MFLKVTILKQCVSQKLLHCQNRQEQFPSFLKVIGVLLHQLIKHGITGLKVKEFQKISWKVEINLKHSNVSYCDVEIHAGY